MSELAPPAPPALPDPAATRSGPGWSRKKKAIAAGAVVGLLAVAGVAFGIARGREEPVAAPKSDVPRRVGDAIEVSAAFRESTRIATTPAIRAPLAPLVTVIGEVTFDPTRVAAVGTRSPGIVSKVFFVEGDTVAKGDVMARIEAPGLTEAQAELRIASAKRAAAVLNAKRERDLFQRGLTTAREVEQSAAELAEQSALVEAAKERVAALGGASETGVSELRAPVGGLLAERSIAPGQNVGPGVVAFRVGDLDELWVLLRVFERHLGLVRPGDAVDIRPVAVPDLAIAGKVAHVGAVINPVTRTADVRVEVANEQRLLRPGQAVKATIRASGPAHVALSVPESAVTYVDGEPTVFIAETPTRFIPRTVEIGIEGADRVEVAAGVREGEAVVSTSVLALKSELYR
jgi:cobalt-zinc-cadmium efflux system membrane fusion protein